jgi:hypothetical protein
MTDATTAIAVSETQRAVTVADREQAAGALAHVLGTGDLYRLTNEQRVAHYLNLCESLSVNALSLPFQWIEFKENENAAPVLQLYFKPSGAAQLLRNHHVSVHYSRKEVVGELFVVEAVGRAPDGRTGSASKYVPLTGKYGRLTGRNLANAFMKAETGALRRLAVAMFGIAAGPDADEAAGWRAVTVDGAGRVLEHPTEEQRYLADHPRAARVLGEATLAGSGQLDGAPIAGTTGQEVRPEELERPKRPDGPRPTLRRSEEDVARLLGAWFAAVEDTSLADDDARHRYVEQWTASEGWPRAKQTESLRTFFARATDAEAADFLAHVRALAADEQRANAEAPAELRRGEPSDDDEEQS